VRDRVRKFERIGEEDAKQHCPRKVVGSDKVTNGHVKSTTEAFENPRKQGPNTPVLDNWADRYFENSVYASKSHDSLSAHLDNASTTRSPPQEVPSAATTSILGAAVRLQAGMRGQETRLIIHTALELRQEAASTLQAGVRGLRRRSADLNEQREAILALGAAQPKAEAEVEVEQPMAEEMVEAEQPMAEEAIGPGSEGCGLAEKLRLAEAGHAAMQYEAALAYQAGQWSLQQDSAEATKWFQKASQQGHPDALYALGQCYHFGSGIARDEQAAERCFAAAAQQGHADAQFDLGLILLHRSGGKSNGRVSEDHARWWKTAAKQGHEQARQALTTMGSMAQRVASTVVPEQRPLNRVIRSALGFTAHSA